MKEELKDYINRFISLSNDEFDALYRSFVHAKLSKRECFISANQYCNKLLFVSRGYFRFFHLDAKGNEITSDFYFSPSFITSYTSFITGNVSLVNVQAMDNMEVLELSKEDLYKLFDQYPKIERLARLIAESVAVNSEEHLFMLLNQTAEKRYKMLLEKNPEYVNTIPLQYIASYLGISKETLSRMRKSID